MDLLTAQSFPGRMGVQKPGFLGKYLVVASKFGKKPGFFDRSA